MPSLSGETYCSNSCAISASSAKSASISSNDSNTLLLEPIRSKSAKCSIKSTSSPRSGFALSTNMEAKSEVIDANSSGVMTFDAYSKTSTSCNMPSSLRNEPIRSEMRVLASAFEEYMAEAMAFNIGASFATILSTRTGKLSAPKPKVLKNG